MKKDQDRLVRMIRQLEEQKNAFRNIKSEYAQGLVAGIDQAISIIKESLTPEGWEACKVTAKSFFVI